MTRHKQKCRKNQSQKTFMNLRWFGTQSKSRKMIQEVTHPVLILWIHILEEIIRRHVTSDEHYNDGRYIAIMSCFFSRFYCCGNKSVLDHITLFGLFFAVTMTYLFTIDFPSFCLSFSLSLSLFSVKKQTIVLQYVFLECHSASNEALFASFFSQLN